MLPCFVSKMLGEKVLLKLLARNAKYGLGTRLTSLGVVEDGGKSIDLGIPAEKSASVPTRPVTMSDLRPSSPP